jgi:hypothetical protein
MQKNILSVSSKYLLVLSIFFIHSMTMGQGITLPAESASIKFTNPVVTNNMFMVVDGNTGAEAYTEAATIGGVQCRKIPSGKFLYVGCTRAAVPTSENNLLISITYYGNSANNIWFNYNSISNNYKGADFQKVKNNDWVTTIVTITDAAFNGLMNGSADFRLGFNGEDNYIKEISVHRGALNPDAQTIPTSPNNPNSSFQNKSFAGYQIWHKAGNNAVDWVHWSYGVVPAAGFHVNEDIASFPDLSVFPDSETYPTNFANLGNEKPTRLYNDEDAVIINRQMGWLKNKGLDGVAVQRFVGPIGRGVTITQQSHLTNVKNASEATGRLFYICYDLNGSDATIVDRLKIDWVYEIEQMRALTSSPNYATVNGKPVVEIWGVGYDQASASQCAAMISFLQSRGCYVIGGTPREWRTNPSAGFTSVFTSLDAISPWTVGAYNDITGANNYLNNYMIADKSYCETNGMDYLPVAFAGSANWVNTDMSLSQTDRQGGKLLWQQVVNAKSIGLTSVYYAMLDEFEESTNLINGAVDYFDIPTDQYFETFAKDGIWTSSDYYLRLAARAAQMLRGEVALSTTIPIEYSLGPIYYRNSFESRATTIRTEGRALNTTLKIDPCFYNPSVVSSNGITSPSVAIVNQPSFAKTGLYSVKATGAPTNNASTNYYYKIADTKITVKANMQLSFWKYSFDNLSYYTNVDLIFQSGKRLSALPAYTDNYGYSMKPTAPRGIVGTWQQYTCQIGVGELIGDVITGIIIGYENPATSGSYTAYFDNIIIEDAPVSPNAPVITSSTSASGTVGQAFSYSITATNTPTSYSATGLPSGVTINTTTGVISGTPTVASIYNVTIMATNADGTGSQSLTISVAGSSGQTPYGGTAWPISGKIEAENYDNGGEGVSYHDFETQNKFNLFRTSEAVDVESTGDAGGGYNVGWIEPGEWMEYTVNVQAPGSYTLEARVASANAGTKTMHVEMDGIDISGPISFDATGGWQTYQSITVTTTALTIGQKIMRIIIDAGNFNLNYVAFSDPIALGLFNGIGASNSGKANSKLESNIIIYPNPVKAGSSVNIKLDEMKSGTYQIIVYNYLGLSILEKTVDAKKGIYSLELPEKVFPGYYQLEMTAETGDRFTKKIVIY